MIVRSKVGSADSRPSGKLFGGQSVFEPNHDVEVKACQLAKCDVKKIATSAGGIEYAELPEFASRIEKVGRRFFAALNEGET